MKPISLLLFLCFSLQGMAQVQTICPSDIAPKRYWVEDIEGATYTWTITSGRGLFLGGKNRHEVKIKWLGTLPATLQVSAEKEGVCISDPIEIKIEFNGPNAQIQPLAATNYCTPPASLNATIELTGKAPWSVSYTINAQTFTQENITTPTYTIPLTNLDYGTQYNIALVSVSDQVCAGKVSSGIQTVTVSPKLLPLKIIHTTH